ncbi:MAG: tetratricopeptide repeat protein [Planctomycetota bacterium]
MKLPSRSTVALLVLGCMLASQGCASLKTPWKADAFGSRTAEPPASEGFMSSLSNTTKGISGQFKSMGSAMSSAYSKTKSAVTNRFTAASTDANADDPTSLANMPSRESLGPEIWVTNGQLYEAQNNFAKALDNYTKALEAEPNNEAALLSTARLYARQKQYGQAADFFNKAIAVSPSPSTFNDLALSLQGQGRSPEAQAAVRKAIELDASNPRYRNNLAGMLIQAGRADEAVQELQQVFPPAVANYNVAFLQYQNQNVAAAQQHLQQALKIDPNMKLARDLLAQIGGSNAMQSTMAAYNKANNLYKTAETLVAPQVKANNAVYQVPGMNGAPATSGMSTPPFVGQAGGQAQPGTATQTMPAGYGAAPGAAVPNMQ